MTAIQPELRWHAIGRRKLGIARVYLTPGSGKWHISANTSARARCASASPGRWCWPTTGTARSCGSRGS